MYIDPERTMDLLHRSTTGAVGWASLVGSTGIYSDTLREQIPVLCGGGRSGRLVGLWQKTHWLQLTPGRHGWMSEWAT
jgi:hypothetical protein